MPKMKGIATVLKHHVATVAQMEKPKWLIQKDLTVLVENSVVVIEILDQLKPIVLIWIAQIVQNVKSQPTDVVMLHTNKTRKNPLMIPVVHTQITDVVQTEKPQKKMKLEVTVQDLPQSILAIKTIMDVVQMVSILFQHLELIYIVVKIILDSDAVLMEKHQKKMH